MVPREAIEEVADGVEWGRLGGNGHGPIAGIDAQIEPEAPPSTGLTKDNMETEPHGQIEDDANNRGRDSRQRCAECAHEFEAFPDAVRFAAGLRAAGLRLALASSSKNADAMLRQLSLPDGRNLLSIFDVDLSGADVPRGKPDPALFLLAAKALNAAPADCVRCTPANSWPDREWGWRRS